jgi:DNA (cytosine-5)-methyltransferase 1
VKPEDILSAAGLDVGELDLFDGSPPCASFSTAGKRSAGWGEKRKYSDTVQRSDDLFFEYARLLDGIRPRVFVAENVSGLVKGVAKGYFIEVMRTLKRCGYRVAARVLDAQWLGVPQSRQRLIFVGVRDDLNLAPVHPAPLPYRYSVRDVLPHILAQGDNGGFGKGAMRTANRPSGAIGAGTGTGNGVAPPSFVIAESDVPSIDPETGADISIARFAIGAEWARLRPGMQSEKYFSLVRPGLDSVSLTITAKGGQVDAASVTHPTRARKFTLAELRQICGFPADFVLTGTYTQRWERLGRAVPPVMMAHIAATVRDRILREVPR